MAFLGNIIWFLCGGAALALFWLVMALVFYITIVGAPIGRACLEFAKLSAFPFGKELERLNDLSKPGAISGIRGIINTILNIIWFPIGLCFTLVYFVLGVLSFVTIIGIPVGIVYIRMGKFLLFPLGVRVVEKR